MFLTLHFAAGKKYCYGCIPYRILKNGEIIRTFLFLLLTGKRTGHVDGHIQYKTELKKCYFYEVKLTSNVMLCCGSPTF
jgi:hypothetical protein